MIVGAGCSFTAGLMLNYQYEDHLGDIKETKSTGCNLRQAWPYQLSKIMGDDFVNVGVNGACNKLITEVVVDSVYKYKPDKVFVQWSEASRIHFVAGRENIYFTDPAWQTYLTGNMYDFGRYHPLALEYVKTLVKTDTKSEILYRHIRESLIQMKILETFLKDRGIKFVFAQGTNLVNPSDWFETNFTDTVELLSDIYYNEPYFRELDDSKWVNFPGIKAVRNEGETFQDYFYENGMRSTDTEACSDMERLDSHPGIEGHKWMAEQFYNKYKELYG